MWTFNNFRYYFERSAASNHYHSDTLIDTQIFFGLHCSRTLCSDWFPPLRGDKIHTVALYDRRLLQQSKHSGVLFAMSALKTFQVEDTPLHTFTRLFKEELHLSVSD